MLHPSLRAPVRRGSVAFAAALALLFGSCDSSNSGPFSGVAPEPVIGEDGVLPGVVVTIEAVRGHAAGKAKVGDLLEVDFRIATDAGEPLELATSARTGIMVSGPTNNYQRVIASQSDVATRATKRALGAYTYKFAVPVPATYLAPLNDTTDLSEGELTGEALLDGTYTVGLEIRRDYTIDGEVYRDPGNATLDFLFGDATTIETRELVTLANCNKCHTELRGHGDNRNNIANCLLCHTAGAEDKNDPAVAGGTPGAAIDFKVMIHRIHSGKHLPSVLGVTTNPDGSRNYDATPQPYQLVGYGNAIHDYSTVTWPAWPSFYSPMPRDLGFSALNSTRQSKENEMRRGPSECAECHGDPDGDGPLPAPAQGEQIWSRPTITNCTSCHDDWEPSHAYTANGSTMPPQADSAACAQCHRESGTPLDMIDAHRHPLVDPSVAVGLRFDVSAVEDVGGTANGRFETGEKVQITFSAVDGENNPVSVSSLSRLEVILSGPTVNPQIISYQQVPRVGFTGNGPYTFLLPELVFYEPIGTSDGNLNNFSTARAPHWNVTGALTTLLRVTGTGASTTLAAAAERTHNFIDVATGTGASFAKNDYIVIDDASPGLREFLRIQWVDGDRIWFGSQFRTTYKPNLKIAHAIGASVTKVTTTSVATSSYTLDPVTGLVTETVEFGNGEVLASYTTDFVVPDLYPGALDDSPVLGESWGDWTGLPLIDGTYTLDVHGARSLVVTRAGENTSYTEGAESTLTHLLFGNATTVVEVPRVDAESCYGCHNSLQFHGGSRRSLDACLSCHATAGAENTLVYENQTTGNPLGTPVEFRHFIHSLHKEVFPAMPGGVQDCAKCHGNNTVWKLPAERNHPSQSILTRSWYVACSSCHDGNAAKSHMDVNSTIFGAEACDVCHGTNDPLSVENVHRIK